MTIRATEIGGMGTKMEGRSRPLAALGPRARALIEGGSKSRGNHFKGTDKYTAHQAHCCAKMPGWEVI
jgi:hypothetical protein